MKSVVITGANSNWIENNRVDYTKKYHKYFRQRDTLISIPKILEEKLKSINEDKYNELVNKASEDRSKITVDEIVKTYPESAAIVVD